MFLNWFYNIFALVIICSPPWFINNLKSRYALGIDVEPLGSKELKLRVVGLGMGTTPSIIL
jgi:hypothetical protein